MRELLVLRHAEAAAAAAGEDDRSRPLTPYGMTQARDVGTWLAGRQELCPDRVLCSSARRTRATAALVIAAWATSPPVTYLEAIYAAMPGELLALLSRHGTNDRVLLVGHNPGVQQLVTTLCPDVPPHHPMPPAALARIVLDGALEPGAGRLAMFRTG